MRILILLMSLLLVGCSQQQELSVVAFKVGKADCFLISQGDEYMLIDTGEEDDGKKIVELLRQHNITKLHTLIITHFDKDHVGGANYILNEIVVDNIYAPNYDSTSKQSEEFWQTLKKKNQRAHRLTENLTFQLGQAAVTIMPAHETFKGDNDNSLITSIVFEETSFLFTGDAEEARLAHLLKDGLSLQHTFLKVPHHGRFNAQTTAFIEAVQPEIAVIPSSDKNPEDARTVAALQQVGAAVYTTRTAHTQFVSDGKKVFEKTSS